MKKKVSIVVPIFNVDKYLDQCVLSILNQEYKNIEVILVDDGSTDKSGLKCDQYKTTDPRVKVIHQMNQGHGPACNVGIKESIGEYLYFCDGDDYLFPNTIKRLVETAEKNKVKVAICTAYAFDDLTKEVIIDPTHSLIRIPRQNDNDTLSRKTIIREANKLSARPWDKILDAEWLKKEGIFFPEISMSYDDVPFHWLVLAKTQKVALIREQLYAYRLNRVGASCYQIKQSEFLFVRMLTFKILKKSCPELIDGFIRLFVSDMAWLEIAEKGLESETKEKWTEFLYTSVEKKQLSNKTKKIISDYLYTQTLMFKAKNRIKAVTKAILNR